MSDFAPPLKKLAEIGVAAAPTGGMGLALDDKGGFPTGLPALQLNEGHNASPSLVKMGRKTATTDGGGNITVTYGTPFPSATDYVIAVSVAASTQPVYRIGTWSASSFVAFFNAATATEDFFWVAIGH